MKTRRLGRTGIQVGEIGLGTEYLNGQSRETVCSVIREAADKGVSYIDVLFAFQEYRENIGAAIKGIRPNLTTVGHIGCAETAGQYRRTRDIAECRYLFEDLLVKLDTDYVDVLMVQ